MTQLFFFSPVALYIFPSALISNFFYRFIASFPSYSLATYCIWDKRWILEIPLSVSDCSLIYTPPGAWSVEEVGKKRDRKRRENKQLAVIVKADGQAWHPNRLYALLCSLSALGPSLQDTIGYSVNRLIQDSVLCGNKSSDCKNPILRHHNIKSEL